MLRMGDEARSPDDVGPDPMRAPAGMWRGLKAPLDWTCGTPATSASRLRRLLPEPYVLLECVSHHDDLDVPHRAETAQVAAASAQRRLEYLAGRHCARRVLARFGAHRFALLSGRDGAPNWPAPVVGSVTHSHESEGGMSAAVVALRTCCAGVGIDAEPCRSLPGCVWPIVFVEPELAMLRACPAAARGLLARLLFSAKHAVIKAFRPVLGRALEYQMVQLRPAHTRGNYVARIGQGRGAARCEVRFSFADTVLLTAVVLPPRLRRM